MLNAVEGGRSVFDTFGGTCAKSFFQKATLKSTQGSH